MSEKFRVAVIGCGGIARKHIEYLSDNEHIDLRAVCDIRKERAEAVARQTGAQAVFDHRELLNRDDIDIVHLCLPHDMHAPVALDFLKAGKRVLTEKPIASEVSDALEMIKNADGRLSVVFQNRWNPATVMAWDVLRSGKLGKLLQIRGMVSWHRTPQYYEVDWRGSWKREGGGVLINQAIHTIDLMQWFSGGDAVSISGSVSTDMLYDHIEVEDSAHFTLKMDNGIICNFFATTTNAIDAPIELELYCEKGSLLLKADSLYQRDEAGETALYLPKVSETGDKAYWGSGHSIMFDVYYRCLRENTPFPVDGAEAIKALKILKSVYISSKENRPVLMSEWKD